ncbi:GDP-mannose 4,6-dehydratase [bacterium]|nr:GDP-mannose 4,6-dehydratase [bacterium]
MGERGINHVLVTGGAGFIGSHVVDRLLETGCRVTVIDNLANGRMSNIRHHSGNSAFQFVRGSILNRRLVGELMQACDRVINMATLGVRHSIRYPFQNHRLNAEGALLLLEAAREHGIKKFIQISSSEVYGTAVQVPQNENHRTFPHTIYGASKLAGDTYTRACWSTYRFPTVIVRPFNTFGPRSHYEGDAGEFIPKSIVRALNGLPILIFGDGKQTRDLSYVTDIADGIVRVCESGDVIGETINLGCGNEYKIIDIARKILKLAGSGTIEFQEKRPGDVTRLFADASHARECIGYRPRVDFDEGLKRTVEWFRSQNVRAMIRKETGRNWE